MPMNEKMPIVSIVVKTHNRCEMLKRALECLVNQTYKSIEIIVLDHDSHDETHMVVKAFREKIIYHR